VIGRIVEAAAGPQVEDRALHWRGTAVPGEPAIRVAHFGDCSWREMARSHGVHTRPGFPLAMAEAIAPRGLEFSSWVAHEFRWLPKPEELDVHLRLTGEPDVVLVQLGAIYSRLVILPDRPEILRLRARISRRLGRRVFAAYRPLRPLVAAVGRFSVRYEGAQALVPFLAAVQARWPHARLVVLLPFRRSRGARRQHEMQERVREDVRACAEAAGVEWIDLEGEIGPDRCANGYNLGPDSSRRVGRRLARALLRQPARA
jgi:hypothetical protein